MLRQPPFFFQLTDSEKKKKKYAWKNFHLFSTYSIKKKKKLVHILCNCKMNYPYTFNVFSDLSVLSIYHAWCDTVILIWSISFWDELSWKSKQDSKHNFSLLAHCLQSLNLLKNDYSFTPTTPSDFFLTKTKTLKLKLVIHVMRSSRGLLLLRIPVEIIILKTIPLFSLNRHCLNLVNTFQAEGSLRRSILLGSMLNPPTG